MATETLFNQEGVSLTTDEATGIHTLRLDRGPNVVNPDLVRLLKAALDRIEASPHPKSLIVTGGRGSKFFSNGLDLKFLQKSTDRQKAAMIVGFWECLARLLVMDCATVAAINGHAFGAGLFLALACDYRIMRTQRGYLCWPEANLGMRLAKGFSELTKAKVTDPAIIREGVLTGKRYGSGAALAAKLIDADCAVEDLEQKSLALAQRGLPESLGLQYFNPETYRMIKIELYVDAYRALTSGKFDAPPQSRL
jgi:enoyl-CoA hydratase/carnithine racemase